MELVEGLPDAHGKFKTGSLRSTGSRCCRQQVHSTAHLPCTAITVLHSNIRESTACRAASTTCRPATVPATSASVSKQVTTTLSSPLRPVTLQDGQQLQSHQVESEVLGHLRVNLPSKWADAAADSQQPNSYASVETLQTVIRQQSNLVQTLQHDRAVLSSNIVPAAAVAAAAVPIELDITEETAYTFEQEAPDLLFGGLFSSDSSMNSSSCVNFAPAITIVTETDVQHGSSDVAPKLLGDIKRRSSNGTAVKKTWRVVDPAVQTDADANSKLPSVWMAGSSDQGTRPYMEDVHSHCHLDLTTPVAYAGLFDGHGGRMTADHAAQQLHKVVHNSLSKAAVSGSPLVLPNQYQPVLKSAFNQLDKDWSEATSGQPFDGSGSTAVVALVNKNNLVVANTGDSVAVLARDGSPVRLSELHKPESQAEAARVMAAGGIVFKSNQGSLRVKQNPDTLPAGERYAQQPTVAVTRSLGDFKLKRRNHPILTPDPYINQIALNTADTLLLLTSDGVTDVLTDEQMMEVALDAVHKARPTADSGEALAQAAAAAVKLQALKCGAWDNVTALAVLMNWAQ